MIASVRFGLGARPSGRSAVAASDDRAWLLQQLEPAPVPALLQALPPSHERVRAQVMLLKRMDNDERRQQTRQIGREELVARTRVRLTTERPFFERWVAFWSNHFTVSLLRPEVRFLAAVHERSAIRPHVLGSFADLLRASTLHPAMLLYLDNVASIGPTSRAGRLTGRGLNENLAREVLELHTLGVDGGYQQADVQALAALLTGWTVVDDRRQVSGSQSFVDTRHEPGVHPMLGRGFGGRGAADATEALDALASHPSTAAHVARRLARHFCADQPPESLVTALTEDFLATGGDLRSLATTLVTREECWSQPWAKVRTPEDLVTALGRALELEDMPETVLEGLERLGQYPFSASSPEGWSDRAEDWVSAAAVTARIDVARESVRQFFDRVDDPEALAIHLLGEPGAHTLAAIGGAATRADALATLLVCPEFQRR